VSGRNDQQEFVKLSASGTTLAAAFMICGIPRRTLRDWVGREGSLKKLERNAVLSAVAEKQLHPRIIRLQVGFGLRLNHIRRFAVQICKECSMKNPWKGRIAGKGKFAL
jgi:hypothetical protein